MKQISKFVKKKFDDKVYICAKLSEKYKLSGAVIRTLKEELNTTAAYVIDPPSDDAKEGDA